MLPSCCCCCCCQVDLSRHVRKPRWHHSTRRSMFVNSSSTLQLPPWLILKPCKDGKQSSFKSWNRVYCLLTTSANHFISSEDRMLSGVLDINININISFISYWLLLQTSRMPETRHFACHMPETRHFTCHISETRHFTCHTQKLIFLILSLFAFWDKASKNSAVFLYYYIKKLSLILENELITSSYKNVCIALSNRAEIILKPLNKFFPNVWDFLLWCLTFDTAASVYKFYCCCY